MFQIGQKVTYIAPKNIEHGIVKGMCDDKHVFVVYHCGGSWDQYFDYTAAKTDINNLVPGWVESEVCIACDGDKVLMSAEGGALHSVKCNICNGTGKRSGSS